MLRPGGTAVVMLYNRHSLRQLVKVGCPHGCAAAGRATQVAALYDTNAAGEAAPHTDYVSPAQVAASCSPASRRVRDRPPQLRRRSATSRRDRLLGHRRPRCSGSTSTSRPAAVPIRSARMPTAASGASHVTGAGRGRCDAVDRYWTAHRPGRPLPTPRASERYLEWRFDEYPLFREFSGLWGEHDGEVILDYGCGPGNDLTGFAIHTGARRLIGIDVSETALDLARAALALHGVARAASSCRSGADGDADDPARRTTASTHVNCQGVLHHTSHPDAILAEFAPRAAAGRHGDDDGLQPRQRLAAPLHGLRAHGRRGRVPAGSTSRRRSRATPTDRSARSRAAIAPEDFLAMCEGGRA